MKFTPVMASRSWLDHVVMLGCALVGFSNLYCTQSIGNELMRLFGLSMQQSTALLMATMLGLAVSSPFVGIVVQKVGLRRVLIAGLAVLGFLSLGMAIADDFVALLALRSVQGAAMPMVLSTLLTSIERQSSQSTALDISATYVMGTICGGVLGRLLPAILVPTAGWNVAFLSIAVLHIAALLLVIAYFPAQHSVKPIATGHERCTSGPILLGVYAGGFALLFSQMAVFTYIAFRLAAAPFGWNTETLGKLYLVFLPSLVIVRSSRRIVTELGHAKAVGAAVLLSWCGLIATLADEPSIVVSGLVLFSIAVFFAQAVLAHALSVSLTSSRAKASGGYLFFYYLGGSLGAITPMIVWKNSGWIGCLCLIGVLQLTLAFFTWATTSRRYHQTPQM